MWVIPEWVSHSGPADDGADGARIAAEVLAAAGDADPTTAAARRTDPDPSYHCWSSEWLHSTGCRT